MKKVLLSLLLAFVCMQVSTAAGDLPLSLNDIVVFGDNSSFDPATGVITFGNNYSPGVGWEFDTPINHTEYPYLKLVFAAKNKVNMLEIKADKVDGGEINIGIPQDVTAFIFNLTDDVNRIYLQSSNWDNFPEEPPYPTLTLVSATLLAPFEVEKVPLPLSDVHGAWWGGYADVEASTINLVSNWEFVGWDFDEWGAEGIEVTGNEMDGYAIDANVYIGAGFFFEPMEFQRVDFRGTTYEGADFYMGIPVGGTSVQVSFAEDIWRLGFQYSNYDDVEQDDPVIKITEAYLLKKVQGVNSLKKINANAGPVDVYTILGVKVRSQVEAANALTGLEKGIYIVGGKKVFITK